MRYIFLVLLFVQGIIIAQEKTTRHFHALIVYDSGRSVMNLSYLADVARMKKTFRNITEALKLPLRMKVCAKQTFSVADFESWAKKISSSRDIAFVYYVGGQTTTAATNSPWPSITLSREDSSSTIPVDSLMNIILKRKPRLAIVLADCYEKLVCREKHSLAMPRLVSLKHHRYKRKRLHEMFIETRGNLTICSHRQGEVGYGVDVGHQFEGSLTRAFLFSQMDPWGFLNRLPSLIEEDMTRNGLPEQHMIAQWSIKDHIPHLPGVVKKCAFRKRSLTQG